jgi:hypothetical protein
MKNRDTSSKLMRWSLKLQEFNFEILHRSGKENKLADAMSRNVLKEEKYKIMNIAKRIKIDENIAISQPDFINKEKIINEVHTMLGHANPRTTYSYLKSKYFWETMREDTNKFVRNCKECLLFNDKNKDKGVYPLMIGEAFERVGIDLMGPFNETKNGN